MEKINNLSALKINHGVFFYTGNPSLIINLNGERACKLVLASSEEIQILSLIHQSSIKKDNKSSLNNKRENEILKWIDQKILIKEDPDRKEKIKSRDPFLALFQEFLSTNQLTQRQHNLSNYHRERITDPIKQFDEEEITLSHDYRFPHPALDGLSYGARFAEVCNDKGFLKTGMKILEIGGGIGLFGNAFLSHLKEIRPDIYNTSHYTFFDLSPALLSSQKNENQSHSKIISFIGGDIDKYDFGPSKFDLVISNEMIADLEVSKLKKAYFHADEMPPESLREIVEFCKRCKLNFEDAFEEFLINTGAFRFILKLNDILSSDGKAIIVEYGDLRLYPNASVLRGHTEFSIHFGHLTEVARSMGFDPEITNALDFLGFKEDEKVLDYFSLIALKEHLLPFFDRHTPIPHIRRKAWERQ